MSDLLRLPRITVTVDADKGTHAHTLTLDQSTMTTRDAWTERPYIDLARAYLREYATLCDDLIRLDSESLAREMRMEAKRKEVVPDE